MTRPGDSRVKNLVMKKKDEDSIFNTEGDEIELFQRKSLPIMLLGEFFGSGHKRKGTERKFMAKT